MFTRCLVVTVMAILSPSLGLLMAQGNPAYLVYIPDAIGNQASVRASTGNVGVAGLSLGVCHDPVAATALFVESSEDLATSFFVDVDPLANGWAVGIVVDFGGMVGGGLLMGDSELCVATYSGNFPGASTFLEFCEDTGSPPLVDTVLVLADQSSIVPATQGGTLILTTPFIRGDGNSNGTLGIDDVLVALEYMFLAGASECVQALDSNADDSLSVVDPLYALQFLFLGAPAPATPFPDCGTTMALSELSCDSFAFCAP